MKNKIFGVVLVVLTTILFPFAQAWGQTNSGATNVARLLGIKPLSINGVPDALPIWTTNAVRSYIVSDSGLGLNVFVDLGFYDGGVFYRLPYKTGVTWGYESYNAFVDYAVYASTQILTKFGHEPNTSNYTPDKDVWATVSVRYLDGPKYRTGLYMSKNIGYLATITEESLRDAFSLATESTTEQLIFSVPDLKRHRVEVVMEDGKINFFEWDMGNVTTSPSWPKLSPDSTTNGWVALGGWYCTGKYPVRITIETTTGAKAVYTEYGDKLVAPVMKMIDKQTLRIKAARGLKVKIYSSTNNVVWKLATSFTSDNAYGTTVPIVSLADKLFFKATCE